MSPDEAARWLRHLAGDTSFKLNQEGPDRTYLLEDLTHRIVALADELEGNVGGLSPEESWTPAYELTDWDELMEGHWV